MARIVALLRHAADEDPKLGGRFRSGQVQPVDDEITRAREDPAGSLDLIIDERE